jgi:hypothetical protein
MVLGLNLKTIPGFICVHLRASAAKNAFVFPGVHLRPKDREPRVRHYQRPKNNLY